MSEFEFNDLNLNRINKKFEEDFKKRLEEIGKAGEEKINREKRILEMQEKMVEQNEISLKLEKEKISVLKSLNEDTKKLVELIASLEKINIENGKISNDNLLEIKKQINKIIENTQPENLQETFINEVKNKIINNGVNYGIQFLITGLKTMMLT